MRALGIKQIQPHVTQQDQSAALFHPLTFIFATFSPMINNMLYYRDQTTWKKQISALLWLDFKVSSVFKLGIDRLLVLLIIGLIFSIFLIICIIFFCVQLMKYILKFANLVLIQHTTSVCSQNYVVLLTEVATVLTLINQKYR